MLLSFIVAAAHSLIHTLSVLPPLRPFVAETLTSASDGWVQQYGDVYRIRIKVDRLAAEEVLHSISAPKKTMKFHATNWVYESGSDFNFMQMTLNKCFVVVVKSQSIWRIAFFDAYYPYLVAPLRTTNESKRKMFFVSHLLRISRRP